MDHSRAADRHYAFQFGQDYARASTYKEKRSIVRQFKCKFNLNHDTFIILFRLGILSEIKE